MKNKLFKIISITIFIPIILFILNGCNINKSDSIEITVDAKVIENNLNNAQLIISGINDDSLSYIGDKCIINCKSIKIFNASGDEISQENISVNNIITIMYDGNIQEVYPTIITNPKWIQVKE